MTLQAAVSCLPAAPGGEQIAGAAFGCLQAGGATVLASLRPPPPHAQTPPGACVCCWLLGFSNPRNVLT